MTAKYSLIIRWSDEDQCYLAWVPEFGIGVKTHGDSYEEAARAGREVIESLIEPREEDNRPLPEPWLFSDVKADEVVGKYLFPSNSAYQDPSVAGRVKQVKHATT